MGLNNKINTFVFGICWSYIFTISINQVGKTQEASTIEGFDILRFFLFVLFISFLNISTYKAFKD